MFLYLVQLRFGRSNKGFVQFIENVGVLNAKSPDFGGINNVCLIAHHMDAKTIHMLCSEGLNKKDVSVEEITRETLSRQKSGHAMFLDTIDNYFRPHMTFKRL